MVICLQQGADDLHNYGPADATVTPSFLASLKSRMIQPLICWPSSPRLLWKRGC